MRLRLPLALALLALAATAAPAAADCPGAAPACAYSAASQIGQRGEGVLRFPQAVSVGPGGSLFVARPRSHLVQVFAPDGRFLGEFGIASTGAGTRTSGGAVAVPAGR